MLAWVKLQRQNRRGTRTWRGEGGPLYLPWLRVTAAASTASCLAATHNKHRVWRGDDGPYSCCQLTRRWRWRLTLSGCICCSRHLQVGY